MTDRRTRTSLLLQKRRRGNRTDRPTEKETTEWQNATEGSEWNSANRRRLHLGHTPQDRDELTVNVHDPPPPHLHFSLPPSPRSYYALWFLWMLSTTFTCLQIHICPVGTAEGGCRQVQHPVVDRPGSSRK